VPGRVIHQSGVRIDPLAHSQLPDAEAQVIRNLMERIDALENALERENQDPGKKYDCPAPAAQSLRDREILEFLEGSGI
jgi:serine O-acetyltransferase